MAITFLSGGFTEYAARVGTTGIAPAVHASTLSGDLMLVFQNRFEDDWNEVTPSGWTKLAEHKDANGAPDRTMLLYGKFATGDAPSATNFTNSSSYDDQWSAVCITVQGAHASDMLDVTYNGTLHHVTFTNKSLTNVDVPKPITTNTDGAVVVIWNALNKDDVTSTTAPSGYTLLDSLTGAAYDERQQMLWYKEVATAGTETPAAPAYTSNATAADDGFVTIALKPGTYNQALTPSLFSNSNTFYSATVTTGAVDLTPSLFTNSNSFYTHVVAQPAATQDLTPSLFTNSNSFYTQTVTTGVVDLTPGLFSNSNTFYTQTVSTGAVDLTPSLFSNSNSFYTHVITTGTVDLTPSLFSNSNTFYTQTISLAATDAWACAWGTAWSNAWGDTSSCTVSQNLSPSLFTNSNSFFTHVITTGVVDLTPSLFTNSNTFYTHTVATGSVDLTPDLFSNSNAFYTHVISLGGVTLTPALFTNSNSFYTHTVTTGVVDLTPSLFSNSGTFFSHVVTQDAQDLSPDLYTDADTFYAATVSVGAVNLQPPYFENSNTFYSHSVAVEAVTISVAWGCSWLQAWGNSWGDTSSCVATEESYSGGWLREKGNRKKTPYELAMEGVARMEYVKPRMRPTSVIEPTNVPEELIITNTDENDIQAIMLLIH